MYFLCFLLEYFFYLLIVALAKQEVTRVDSLMMLLDQEFISFGN